MRTGESERKLGVCAAQNIRFINGSSRVNIYFIPGLTVSALARRADTNGYRRGYQRDTRRGPAIYPISLANHRSPLRTQCRTKPPRVSFHLDKLSSITRMFLSSFLAAPFPLRSSLTNGRIVTQNPILFFYKKKSIDYEFHGFFNHDKNFSELYHVWRNITCTHLY